MLVVYGIFVFQSPFNNVLGGCIAVAVGWIIVILTSLQISKVELSAITLTIELSQLEEKDTAKNLGALFFGWVYPLILIELIWCVHYLFYYCKDKNYIPLMLLKHSVK
jgi:hypothetical protein